MVLPIVRGSVAFVRGDYKTAAAELEETVTKTGVGFINTTFEFVECELLSSLGFEL